MSEIWLPCTVDPAYEVSSEGGVRRVGRRPLRPFIVKSTGYFQVNLSKRRRCFVHRLVAEAFIENPNDLPQVNHKDGDRGNNKRVNLEWVSPGENISHSYEYLGRKGTMAGRFSSDHNTSKAVLAEDMVTGEVVRYPSAMDAVREGYGSSAISRCCHGRMRYHKGRYWRFVEEAS